MEERGGDSSVIYLEIVFVVVVLKTVVVVRLF